MAVKIFQFKDLSGVRLQLLLANLLFWIVIFTIKIITDPYTIESVEEFILLIVYILQGCIITYILTIIYRSRFWQRIRQIYQITAVFFLSLVLTLSWYFSLLLIAYLGFNQCVAVTVKGVLYWVAINSIYILLWNSLYVAYTIWQDRNDQKFQLEHERALLKTSQLEMLKYQLNPHFLFNSLSSLRGLINSEPVKAKAMVTQIAEFLRYSLVEGKNNFVPLLREMEIIRHYINIEKVRFEDDLIVDFDISEESNDLMIPIFLINPLVENAIKYGMHTSRLPLHVFIAAKISGNSLIINVKNSGKWVDEKN